ncbi:UvrD-helicase domain-containing protein [Leptolyngbya sp. CCNP1308]|uniref:UvrD-helicase domain-containing protein n=1 Tax=Leptolyngbya sp. CCNP1308 TaxID=3110255 RepID=UPI002B1F0FFA|nr:UvrD-helicase domain-containing protein [Leptolyngbya sp. CCNP1308]MEA5449323.1 UvrD-helicase domain-containing protein [Leptolyngbya sp. CCNP1308]
MAQLMMHAKVFKNFYKLPTKVQKKVATLIEKFQVDPWDPAIGLHGLQETMLDGKVRGADLPDGYRAIVIAPEQGDTFLLVHIDSHDRAYDWAKNKRFEVHGSTGAFQIFDAQATQQAVQQVATPKTYSPGNRYVLQQLSDDELFHAGVPQMLIPAVREVRSDYDLDMLSKYLPDECAEVLIGYAAGLSLDEALAQALGSEIEATTTVAVEGPGDFSKLTQRSNRDLVIVDGEDALKAIFQGGSLEEWRIFLHPRQRQLVEWEVNGPMSITGAAGTGKTVALLHRAVHLARKLDNPKDKILLVTFSTNLAITLKGYIPRLDPTVADQIEVTHLNQLARTICQRGGWKGRIASPEERDDLWNEVWADPTITGLPMSKLDLQEEFNLVVDANGIETEEAYLTTVRTGRPRLGRKQRREAWPVFKAFKRLLLKRNLMTFEGAIHQARLVVDQGNFPQFRHVLADEVQDFSLEGLRLLAALSPLGDGQVNPLSVAGDGHQRIYRTRVPLSRAGIEVRGRSKRLKVNYRTSEQIRRFAEQILDGLDVDDLDDGKTSTVGDRSVFTGPTPEIAPCTDEPEEARVIAQWAKTLVEAGQFSDHEICVTPYKPDIRAALQAEGLKTYELQPRQEDPGPEEPGVRLGTMKRIKGLEFKAIAMACTGDTDAMNDLTNANLLDKCERYVAATRARESLLICVQKS